MLRPLLPLLFVLISAPTSQDPVPAPAPAPAAATDGTPDGASVDALLAAVYACVSGPAGQPRDFARMRRLFLPQARLHALVPARGGGTRRVELTLDDYAQRVGPQLERDGMFEQEIARRVDRFGPLAQVFSSYEIRRKPDAPPVMRGINSFQLVQEGERWWIASLAWANEAGELTLPPEYLPKPEKR